jgi:hypothetical protein
MDPQACLQRIIDAVRRSAEHARRNEEVQDGCWLEITIAFDDLGDWLRRGGFPPVATGPIFGDIPMNVGYPGMICGSLPRTVPSHIKHVQSVPAAHYRYAIMLADQQGQDFTHWVMVEYDTGGGEINRWAFRSQSEISDNEH